MNRKALLGVLGGLGAAGVAIGYFGSHRGRAQAMRLADQARNLRDQAMRRADDLRDRVSDSRAFRRAGQQPRGEYQPQRSGVQMRDQRFSGSANLNSASREHLLQLSGIDEVLADRIIENRPYRNKMELISRVMLPQDVYDGIKDQVHIDDTQETVKVA